MTSSTHHFTDPSERRLPPVTQEQLDKCMRCIDVATGEVFYRVASESDPEKTYTVRALRSHGEWHLTCTCPAGQEGAHCKHKRWAKAHADEYYRLREAATTIVGRHEKFGTVEYIVKDETGYNLVRLGRSRQEDHCYAPECLPLSSPCHHLRIVRRAERQFRQELARYTRGIA